MIGDVESVAFEEESGAGGKKTFAVGSALGAGSLRFVAHSLKQLELVSLGTPVLVRGHGPEDLHFSMKFQGKS